MTNTRSTTASIVSATVAVLMLCFGVFGYYVTGAAEEEAREVVKPVVTRVEAVRKEIDVKLNVMDGKVDINTTNIAVVTSKLESVTEVMKLQNERLDKIIDKL